MENKTQHIKQLAEELLEEIELSKLSIEALLLKVGRLARLTDSEEITNWLWYERHGYNSSEPLSLKYLSLTGRWIDKEKNQAHFGALAVQEQSARSSEIQLQQTTVPSMSHQYANVAVFKIIEEQQKLRNVITGGNTIKSKVLALLHDFVSKTYYEVVFRNIAESIFEQYKIQVDSYILQKCGGVIEKIGGVSKRLAEGDTEAVSQALNSCRRIIDASADEIYPPCTEPIELKGKKLELGADKQKNRIGAYISKHCISDGRSKKLWETLNNLYARFSSGVHSEVSPQEARALFLELYLFLGEILTLEHHQKDAIALAS